MNRDEAIELLKRGEKGIEEWNRRREAGEKIPMLCEANLNDAKLAHANLHDAPTGTARNI